MSTPSQAGQPLGFDQSLELRKTAEDTFENVHRPWTWHNTDTVPGGLLISECAAAAYKTVNDSFVLDNVQAQFLAKTNPDLPIIYTVKRLSGGKRFAVRLVTASQKGDKNVLCATICFASHPAVDNHPAMTHSIKRETPHTITEITLDDLKDAKSPYGPFMKFQRLPLHNPSPSSPSSTSPTPPTHAIASSACHVAPIPHPLGHKSHILALLNLSDYHVLDAPMSLSHLTFGLFAVNDDSRTPTPQQAKMYTSLNHSVYIHRHDAFRADEICYVEARSPWAADGRAYVTTRIFARDGVLVASCVQEAFYMLNDDVHVGSKL